MEPPLNLRMNHRARWVSLNLRPGARGVKPRSQVEEEHRAVEGDFNVLDGAAGGLPRSCEETL